MTWTVVLWRVLPFTFMLRDAIRVTALCDAMYNHVQCRAVAWRVVAWAVVLCWRVAMCDVLRMACVGLVARGALCSGVVCCGVVCDGVARCATAYRDVICVAL